MSNRIAAALPRLTAKRGKALLSALAAELGRPLADMAAELLALHSAGTIRLERADMPSTWGGAAALRTSEIRSEYATFNLIHV